MKKITLLLIFLLYITTSEVMSQKETVSWFKEIKCLLNIAKSGIQQKKWNLDSCYSISDSLCTDFLSTKHLKVLGDTLLIVPNTNYKTNFTSLKIVADSDSSASVFWYMDNSKVLLKGKAARKMKKNKTNSHPLILKFFITKDSTYLQMKR